MKPRNTRNDRKRDLLEAFTWGREYGDSTENMPSWAKKWPLLWIFGGAIVLLGATLLFIGILAWISKALF
jgi:hypothetical protein